MPRVRMSSWNSIYRGVEINCKDAHIIVSSLPTKSAKLDEILKIEGCEADGVFQQKRRRRS